MRKSAVLETRPTTPVVNYGLTEVYGIPLFRLWRPVYDDIRASGLRPVGWHKLKLGPPSFTWIGGSERKRFAVYDNVDCRLFRLFVANGPGIYLEVVEGLEEKSGLALSRVALVQYLDLVGHRPAIPPGWKGGNG